MDWKLAVEKNGQALRRVLEALVAMAGVSLGDAARPTHLPRRLHRAVLRLLRPAESAARRLLVIAARGLVVAPPPPRCAWSPSPASQGRTRGVHARTTWILPRSRGVRRTGETSGSPRQGTAEGGGGGTASPQRLAFPLFDRLRMPVPRRPPACGVPRISVPGHTTPFPLRRPPAPDDPIDAARLILRLEALARALEDLPALARRFALWQARRDAERAQPGRTRAPDRRLFRRVVALRPGRPPGTCRRGRHEVHAVLTELHGLAVWSLAAPDTS